MRRLQSCSIFYNYPKLKVDILHANIVNTQILIALHSCNNISKKASAFGIGNLIKWVGLVTSFSSGGFVVLRIRSGACSWKYKSRRKGKERENTISHGDT